MAVRNMIKKTSPNHWSMNSERIENMKKESLVMGKSGLNIEEVCGAQVRIFLVSSYDSPSIYRLAHFSKIESN